jgi:hypothetical protein
MHAYLLTNGRVVVGRNTSTGSDRRFARAWLVEKWGTTEGFAQLANGPLPTTTRAVVTDVAIPPGGFRVAIAVNATAWRV